MVNLTIKVIYEQYKNDVYTYLLSLTHDKLLSEDLTSEVFIGAIRSLPSFKGRSSIKTWLFSIARYKWIEHLKKGKKDLATESLTEIYLNDGMCLESLIITKELSALIHSLLTQEPDRNRDVVLMRIEGYSFFEIAQKFGISESSARVLDFRTKHKIKEILLKEGYHNV